MPKSKKVKQIIRIFKRFIPFLIVAGCILLFRGTGICAGDMGSMNDQCLSNFDCSNRYFCEKDISDCEGEGECQDKPSSCLDEWQPVCGCDGKSYPNRCTANSMGVNINYTGECYGSETTCTNNSECPSGSYCRKKPGDCTGQGACTLIPPRCSQVHESVCGCDGKTYSSECEAISMGVNTDYIGECKTVQPAPEYKYGGIIGGIYPYGSSTYGGITGYSYPYGSSTYGGITGYSYPYGSSTYGGITGYSYPYGSSTYGGIIGLSYPYGNSTYGGIMGYSYPYGSSTYGGIIGLSYPYGSSTYGGIIGGLYRESYGRLYGGSYGSLYEGPLIGNLYGDSYSSLYSGGFAGGTLYGGNFFEIKRIESIIENDRGIKIMLPYI